jgi:hypothetical protein
MAHGDQRSVDFAGETRVGREGESLDQGPVWLTLILSPEMNAVVEKLALRYSGAATGRSKADVINRAIGLLNFLSDAAREGKRIGIASPDQELETEITEL